MTGREYLIDASVYWRIDRGAVLAGAWRDQLERGLVWICPPTEMETCRRASKDQHAVHLREFAETYVRVELHHRAGVTAREIQTDLIGCGQAAGVHPVDLLVAATAPGRRLHPCSPTTVITPIRSACGRLADRVPPLAPALARPGPTTAPPARNAG